MNCGTGRGSSLACAAMVPSVPPIQSAWAEGRQAISMPMDRGLGQRRSRMCFRPTRGLGTWGLGTWPLVLGASGSGVGSANLLGGLLLSACLRPALGRTPNRVPGHLNVGGFAQLAALSSNVPKGAAGFHLRKFPCMTKLPPAFWGSEHSVHNLLQLSPK